MEVGGNETGLVTGEGSEERAFESGTLVSVPLR